MKIPSFCDKVTKIEYDDGRVETIIESTAYKAALFYPCAIFVIIVLFRLFF